MTKFTINLRDYYKTLGLAGHFSKWVLIFISSHSLAEGVDYIKVYGASKKCDYFIKPQKLRAIKKTIKGDYRPKGYPYNLHDVLNEFQISGRFTSIIMKISRHTDFKEGVHYVKKLGFYNGNTYKNVKRVQYYISEDARIAIKKKAHKITQQRYYTVKGSESIKNIHYIEEEEEEYYKPCYKGFEIMALSDILKGDKYYRYFEDWELK